MIHNRHIILNMASIYFDKSYEQLTFNKSRCQNISYPRHVIMAVLRELCPRLSYPSIAAIFNCDHTSVLHAVRATKTCPKRQEMYQGLMGFIASKTQVAA
jgi:chromosomal replication initiation ATPase DnaA